MTKTTDRAEAVSDDVILDAYFAAASNTNDEGETVGTLADVLEATGMNKGSLNGRLTALRKVIDLPKLARCPSTGKTRKKNLAELVAKAEAIKAKYGMADVADSDAADGDEGEA